MFVPCFHQSICWYNFLHMSEGIHFRPVFANRVYFCEQNWQLALNAQFGRHYWHAWQCFHQNPSLFTRVERYVLWSLCSTWSISYNRGSSIDTSLEKAALCFSLLCDTGGEVCIECQQNELLFHLCHIKASMHWIPTERILLFHKSEEGDLRDTSVHVITWWDSLM